MDSDREQRDWTWEFSAAMLRCERPEKYYQDIEREQRSLEGDGGSVTQYVARYRSGDARRYVEQIRNRAAACEVSDGMSVDVVAENLAGDDSLWIQVELGSGPAEHVIVRRGDTLTEFTVDSIGTGRIPELEKMAAGRL